METTNVAFKAFWNNFVSLVIFAEGVVSFAINYQLNAANCLFYARSALIMFRTASCSFISFTSLLITTKASFHY